MTDVMMKDVRSVAVECADCGRERWLRLFDLRRHGVREDTPFPRFAQSLRCQTCRADGHPGENVCVTPKFVAEAGGVANDVRWLRSRGAL